jgi:hypothetical protein
MGHEHRHAEIFQHPPRRAPEHEFPYARVTEPAHDKNARTDPRGLVLQNIRDGPPGAADFGVVDWQSMCGKISGEPGTQGLIRQRLFVDDHGDRHFRGAFENDARVIDGPGGDAAAIPGDHYVIQSAYRMLLRQEHDRPARSENDCLRGQAKCLIARREAHQNKVMIARRYSRPIAEGCRESLDFT